MNIDVQYDIFLYKYAPNTFQELNLKDLGDLRITSDTYKKKISEVSLRAEAEKVIPKDMDLTFREALIENYVVQRIQSQEIPYSWLNSYQNKFWDEGGIFQTEALAKKEILRKKLNQILAEPAAYIKRYAITNDPNLVVAISEFKTNLNSLDSSCTLQLDAAKMAAAELSIEENDVIEIVVHYVGTDGIVVAKPVFYGFALNTTDTSKYGDVLERSIIFSGISKFLHLSTVIQDSAIVSQFELGIEMGNTEFNLHETQYNALNVSEIFSRVMGQVLGLSPMGTAYTVPHVFTDKSFLTLESFQQAMLLLVLYYSARKLSSYATTTSATIAEFQSANTTQYKAYNQMLRDAFAIFYSQTVNPIQLLNEIRDKTFYEVYEDRPGTIKCRPPRYNLWFPENEISADTIIESTEITNDAQLLTRLDYKFVFPYFDALPFMGGRWVDLDNLIKYGLRTDAPRSNPQVTSPQLGHIWAALDLVRANLATRVLQVTVPADTDYQVGTLYYFPEEDIVNSNTLSFSPRTDIVSSGIVGYVHSINTSIVYGGVITHRLELLYVRKAEKIVLADGSHILNFYRLPDLETFMQWMEKVKADNNDYNDKTISKLIQQNQAQKVSSADTGNPAIQWLGIYWAVDYEYYPMFQEFIKAGASQEEFRRYFEQKKLANYAFPTDFTPEQFKSKTAENYSPVVTQELINRLFIIDMCFRQILTSESTTAVSEILFEPTGAKFDSAKQDRQSLTKLPSLGNLNLNPGTIYRKRPIASTSVSAFYGSEVHNQDVLEYAQLRSTTQYGLKALLDMWLAIHPVTGKIDNTIFSYNVTPEPNIPSGYTNYSYYYTTGSLAELEYPFEFSLGSIPFDKRITLSNIARAGGLFGYKSEDSIKEPVKNAHTYGMEVDVVPAVLQYWTIQELNDVLSAGILRARTSYTIDPLFNDFTQEKYIMFTLNDAVVNLLDKYARQVDMDVLHAVSGATAASITANFPSLFNNSGHAYTLSGVQHTYHLTVKHVLDISKSTATPVPRKKLHFLVSYNSTQPALKWKGVSFTAAETDQVLNTKITDDQDATLASIRGNIYSNVTRLNFWME